MCVDFKNLRKACPKECYPLPHIYQLVDATSGHELLICMDACSGYNQIKIYEKDVLHTTLYEDSDIYRYIVMPFEILNASSAYQRMVNKMFSNMIGDTMEAYVDHGLVKSKKNIDHQEDWEDFHQNEAP